MRKVSTAFVFAIILFFCLELNASANIAPLSVKEDGVEPLANPGVTIESADITATPDNRGFKFSCNYEFIGLEDREDLTVGIPGDLGFTLEAGYIDNIAIAVNGRPVKHDTYNTTTHLSENWSSYTSPINFKWHTFTIPVKKDTKINVSVSYNISWRMLDQNNDSPYDIVPFIMSTDKLFGDVADRYRIRYISDDHISLPDVKVMINSMLEPNIISAAVLSPEWSDSEIIWEFKDSKDFQDFRLVSLSFSKLSMNFSDRIGADSSIKWAILNKNYEKLAAAFEDIAMGNISASPELDSSDLGTAAYISSEFYMRMKNYDKALEMLLLPDKTELWPVDIKYQYVNSIKLDEAHDYRHLLEELKKLQHQKDFILVSNYAANRIEPVNELVAGEDVKIKEKEKALKPSKGENSKDSMLLYLTSITVIILLLYIVYMKAKGHKK